MYLPVDKAPLIIHTDRSEVRFDVEIARTSEQKARGLMYRHDFPATRAVLYIFSPAQKVTMWMANTPLPLDMIFANRSGLILYIDRDTIPFSRSVISSVYPAAFVLEVNAGQVKAKSIAVGQKMIHPVICGKCGA